MSRPDFEFDVAFSFHGKDEGVATQLNDLLQDRFKTFLYSEQQKVLAGADGEKAFNTVFGEKARFVVVFYRKEWGETPFTRIEQTAIQNRAYKSGYDFTLFILTDKQAPLPPWIPKTRLYYGLDRFGLPGAAGAIEHRIGELGGEPHVESVVDRAGRLNRAHELKEAQKSFRNSPAGIREAEGAYGLLTTALQSKVTSLAGLQGRMALLSVKKHDEYWLVTGLRTCLVIYWDRRYANSLDESVLSTSIHDGMPRLPGLLVFDKPHQLRKMEFDYVLLALDRHGYRERAGEKRSFAAEDLADYLLRVYMDVSEKHEQHTS